ncbi:HD domain-containing protein [Clostridium chauvoei]|uniref:HD domain-containing protein n=1 Tax=Clostridium chauvoei TaxID=46867 RepID=UPI001C86504D|nr:HD domain-containing protein [Clostridium chauvoei]MBX7403324.1 HD domain-containing protein [Clostridium chauvoei]
MEYRYLNEAKSGEKIEISLMIMKILSKEENIITAYIGDKTCEVKALIVDSKLNLQVGEVIKVKGVFKSPFKVEVIKKIEKFDIYTYIPSVKRPIDDILNELEDITTKEFKSPDIIAIDNYFFKDEEFLKKFKMAIGGVYHHHNYLGGLAEHTLNVTYLAKTFAERYNCRYKELAILGAKLHDIGKIREMYYGGPFGYTLEGEMEGHIVIGVMMLEEAFKKEAELYSDEFKERLKGIIVQHHGKLEYGSPKSPKSQESYIVHYADYVDSTFNKIDIIGEGVEPGQWTGYERRIEGRILL